MACQDAKFQCSMLKNYVFKTSCKWKEKKEKKWKPVQNKAWRSREKHCESETDRDRGRAEQMEEGAWRMSTNK